MNTFWKTLFPVKSCPDKDILLWLADGSSNSEQRVMDCLYRRLIATVIRWVLKHGGFESDGHDVLVDALTAFVKNYRSGKYTDSGKLENFVTVIAKNKFIDICRKRKQNIMVSLDELLFNGVPLNIATEEPEVDTEKETQLLKFEQCHAQIGEKCRDRLDRFYYKHQSHLEIAKALGDKSEAVAKVMLGRCKEKLRNLCKDIFF